MRRCNKVFTGYRCPYFKQLFNGALASGCAAKVPRQPFHRHATRALDQNVHIRSKLRQQGFDQGWTFSQMVCAFPKTSAARPANPPIVKTSLTLIMGAIFPAQICQISLSSPSSAISPSTRSFLPDITAKVSNAAASDEGLFDP